MADDDLTDATTADNTVIIMARNIVVDPAFKESFLNTTRQSNNALYRVFIKHCVFA